jgi:hypothetical protein
MEPRKRSRLAVKLGDQAVALPKLNVMAIDQLVDLLNRGFVVPGMALHQAQQALGEKIKKIPTLEVA